MGSQMKACITELSCVDKIVNIARLKLTDTNFSFWLVQCLIF